MADLVATQGTILDRIDHNISSAISYTKQANEELQKVLSPFFCSSKCADGRSNIKYKQVLVYLAGCNHYLYNSNEPNDTVRQLRGVVDFIRSHKTTQ